MSVYTSTDLAKKLSVREEKVYSNLIDLDKFLIQLDDLKKLYENQAAFSQELIPILQRASSQWQNQQQFFNAELIEVFLLQIALQQGYTSKNMDTLLSLLGSLEKQPSPQNLRKVVELSEKYLVQDNHISFQIILLHQLIKALLNLYGVSEKSISYHLDFKKLILECFKLVDSNSIDLDYYKLIYVGITSFYFFDNPRDNNVMRQTLAQLGLRSVQSVFTPETEIYRNKIHKRLSDRVHHELTPRLKIGYMTDFLYQHSIGWLVRWTLHHHNPEEFDVYTYSTFKPNDKLHDRLIEQYGEKIRHIPGKIKNITEQIQEDEIDILIDLGSLTESTNCVVTAVKPAPIQITWLGLDASQIPTVDYYLADRYSLPDEAQEYYSEKLIRMPHCYIAVDGFELDRPSLSRADFDIPDDAVIYLSGQTGAKRHPDNMKLQVKILRHVPNSYFLVKLRKMDEEVALNAFKTLAIEMGVESDRIKAIPSTPTSEIHRANLKIADIILDTYPYNGATTTLEALWCEVPLVTRVGQQFAARNSYSMLMNAGVTEGIAWTDDDYVNWGVMFGLNQELRDRVRWKLRQSKRTSPLWDARQFTRDLETVYQQIWESYLKVNSHEKY